MITCHETLMLRWGWRLHDSMLHATLLPFEVSAGTDVEWSQSIPAPNCIQTSFLPRFHRRQTRHRGGNSRTWRLWRPYQFIHTAGLHADRCHCGNRFHSREIPNDTAIASGYCHIMRHRTTRSHWTLALAQSPVVFRLFVFCSSATASRKKGGTWWKMGFQILSETYWNQFEQLSKMNHDKYIETCWKRLRVLV